MGVIDSLSAGYRFLGRRLELLLIPILLDLLLWLGPRLSLAPIFAQVATFYQEAATLEGMPSEMVEMTGQLSDLLTMTGESSNLLTALVPSLLYVPSLVATLGPLLTPMPQQALVEIGSPLWAVLLFGGLSLLGLLIGVVYLSLIARRLPIGSGPKPLKLVEFTGAVLRHWGMVLLYIVLMVVALLLLSIPAGVAIGLLSLISPAISSLVVVLLLGISVVLFYYLTFVSAALVLDDLPVHRAVVQSLVLVRNNFWATLGLMVLYQVITLGIARLMVGLTQLSPIGTPVAIVINAYIGSGLTMALLVFYRTRILRQEELTRSAGVTS